MKLWLVSQNTNNGYDTYDSAVVAAPDIETARRVEVGSVGNYGSWVAPEHVHVEYIGEAKSSFETGVVCASFNAG